MDSFIESNKRSYEHKATDSALNKHFTGVGPSISSNISYVNGSIYNYFNKKCEKSMLLMSVTESEIASVVNALSCNKSTDYIGLNMGGKSDNIPRNQIVARFTTTLSQSYK